MVDKNIEAAIEAAEKEGGIDMEGDEQSQSIETKPSKKDAKIEDSSSSEPEPSQESGVEAQKNRDNIPLHEDPRFKDTLSRMSRRDREHKETIRKLQDELNMMRGRLDQYGSMTNRQEPQNQLTPEQQQAREQLMDVLGLKDIQSTIEYLKKQNDDLTRAQSSRLMDEEEQSIMDDIEKLKLGNPEDILDKLEDQMKKDPILNEIKGKPGGLRLAFNSLVRDHALSLGKIAANKEMIQHQHKVKKSQTEGSSSKASSGGKTKDRSTISGIIGAIEEAGGEEMIGLDD